MPKKPIDLFTLRTEKLKWSQQKMAEHLRVEQSTVSRIERGILAPSGPIQALIEQLVADAKRVAA